MKLILRRLDADENRIFGQIEDADGGVLARATLEHPYRDEDGDGLTDKGRSCIPAGTYEWFIRRSHKHGGTGSRDYDVIELKGVPGRSNIQCHVGNILSHSLGCCLVGSSRAESQDAMVLGSKPAFEKLMASLNRAMSGEFVVIDAP